jgi:hypothetical protein
MKNIVLILHHEWNAQSLNLILSHPKGAFNIITLPISVSGKIYRAQIKELEESLCLEKLESKDVNYLFIESNYGKPNQEWVNEELFDYCTKTFLNAKIIAVSDTEGSLRKVYNHYERVHLWDSPTVRKMDSILRICSLDEIKPKERKKSKKHLGRRKTLPNVTMLNVTESKEAGKTEEREAYNLMGSLSAPVVSHFPEFPAHDQEGTPLASPFVAQSASLTPLYSSQTLTPFLPPLLFEKLSLHGDASDKKESASGPSGWSSP